MAEQYHESDYEKSRWLDKISCSFEKAKLFHPADREQSIGRELREEEAKKICRTCEVSELCLKYALNEIPASDDGIWGGMNGDERAADKSRRNKKVS